ncbi:hypothetical protein PTTG_30866, partial [Puccinia triticina 1-1 BBBD Race 1]
RPLLRLLALLLLPPLPIVVAGERLAAPSALAGHGGLGAGRPGPRRRPLPAAPTAPALVDPEHLLPAPCRPRQEAPDRDIQEGLRRLARQHLRPGRPPPPPVLHRLRPRPRPPQDALRRRRAAALAGRLGPETGPRAGRRRPEHPRPPASWPRPSLFLLLLLRGGRGRPARPNARPRQAPHNDRRRPRPPLPPRPPAPPALAQQSQDPRRPRLPVPQRPRPRRALRRRPARPRPPPQDRHRVYRSPPDAHVLGRAH